MSRSIADSETVQHLKNLSVYGYTHVESFLDTSVVRRLKALVEEHYDPARRYFYSDGSSAGDGFDKSAVYHLQSKDKLFIDILDDPFLARVLMENLNDPYYRFLPPEVPNYVLSNYWARSSGSRLDLHMDAYVPAPGKRTWAIQVFYILEDQTEENGCSVVVPGSHLSGEFADRALAYAKPLLPRAGDIVIWDSRLWHGTRENRSARSRWALIAMFTMWWIKPTVDVTRSLPDHIYRQLSNRQKALLGFCALPPADESVRINTKSGYEVLRPSVADYLR